MDGIKNFLREEEGATAVEYGLLASLIAGVIIVAVIALGKTLCNVFTGLNKAISTGAAYAIGTTC